MIILHGPFLALPLPRLKDGILKTLWIVCTGKALFTSLLFLAPSPYGKIRMFFFLFLSSIAIPFVTFSFITVHTSNDLSCHPGINLLVRPHSTAQHSTPSQQKNLNSPWGNENDDFYRSFYTSNAHSQVDFSLRVWYMCSVDSDDPAIYVAVDSVNKWWRERQDWDDCADDSGGWWSEIADNQGVSWMSATCGALLVDRKFRCYTDVSFSVAHSGTGIGNSFVLKVNIPGGVNDGRNNEVWAVSDI